MTSSGYKQPGFSSLRAIATKSASLHCSTSARTTRAKLGQCVIATPTATPQAFAERVKIENEQDDMRNAHHKIDEPSHRGIDALSSQGSRRSEHPAMTEETPAARSPTNTLVESPATVRTSISRPISRFQTGEQGSAPDSSA